MSDGELYRRVERHLEVIYPARAGAPLVEEVLAAIGLGPDDEMPPAASHWDQHDVAVITYADSITEAGKVPLRTLHELLDDLTGDVMTVVHVLPFYPASSDGGFAVTDHRAVDPRLGGWDDVADLAETYTVMADLVVNHVSADHPWMEQFCRGEMPGSRFLLSAEPSDDLSSVARPRTTPLLREVETSDGPRLLWCTFSHDQIDLNFGEPDVLVDLLRTVRCLVDAGVRWFRLDAIAYLWKELGTSCLNLPQTHEVVKLLRTLLDARCPDSVIITETNVPHDQNVAYWGDGDEAHLVYNFSLPPLVAHTMISGSAVAMQRWLAQLEAPPPGTSYFNFIASHDGIGLRPVEGLLNSAELFRLIAAAHSAGGTHSEFDTPEGPKAYELNVSLWDLFAGDSDALGIAQFLAAHTIMLSLAGIPALYVHALLGTPSYWAPISEPPRIVTEHGLPPVEQNRRTINRRKLTLDEAVDLLGAQDGVRRRVLVELVRRMLVRRGQPAFHPDSAQTSLDLGSRAFGVIRGGLDWDQTIVSITNVTHGRLTIDIEVLSQLCSPDSAGIRFAAEGCMDLLDDRVHGPGAHPSLTAGQTMWLCLESERREPALASRRPRRSPQR
ncbi:alpha-amylase family glycosyl hydrolase [Candidatus Poriferisodalis sp.]|uniref:alpha-amylase family glycosyl hydrolase n=1 Tax=Candidatus Poriferisodalis sp. TaxID=3101277 RepID=UPI003B51A55D